MQFNYLDVSIKIVVKHFFFLLEADRFISQVHYILKKFKLIKLLAHFLLFAFFFLMLLIVCLRIDLLLDFGEKSRLAEINEIHHL